MFNRHIKYWRHWKDSMITAAPIVSLHTVFGKWIIASYRSFNDSGHCETNLCSILRTHSTFILWYLIQSFLAILPSDKPNFCCSGLCLKLSCVLLQLPSCPADPKIQVHCMDLKKKRRGREGVIGIAG